MKKQILFLFIFLFVLAACSGNTTPKTEPTIPPVPTLTILPTNTNVPTPTITPSPTPDPLIFRDDFNGSIDQGWQMQNVNKKMWSLTNKPGWLELIARSPLGAKNILLRQIPEGNFEIETKMTFEPVANFQVAGLTIFYSSTNYILFGRAYSSYSIGDGFYMDNVKSGKFIDGNFATPVPGTDTIFLRLRREGDSYTSYYSEDGSQWTKIGVHTSTMKPKSVGLAAGQSTSGSQPAQFDYFVINKLLN
jgi:beta-xylosidase